MSDYKEIISNNLNEQVSCLKELSNEINSLKLIIEKLIHARNSNSIIITMGNGGSSSTASHFTADLLKTAIMKTEKRFQAICLTDNIPVLTAWANDTSYDDIFSELLKNYIKKDAIVIAFSGSGKSKNIIQALEVAKKYGAYLIGFTGLPGGDFPKLCDLCVKVPSSNMLTIESFHLMICHIITSCIRETGTPEFSYE